MQLLDDDMDELFRNAASRYPLKTDGANWDALSRRLHPEDDAVPPVPPLESAAPRRTWIWWRGIPVLLLLLASTYWIVSNNAHITPTHKRNDSVTASSSTAATFKEHSQGTGSDAHVAASQEPGHTEQAKEASGPLSDKVSTAARNTNATANDAAVNAVHDNNKVVHDPATSATRNTNEDTHTAARNTSADDRTPVNLNKQNNTAARHTNTTATDKTLASTAAASPSPASAHGKSWVIGIHRATALQNSSSNNINIYPVTTTATPEVPTDSIKKNDDAPEAITGKQIVVADRIATLRAVKDTLPVKPLPVGPITEKVKVQTGLYAGIMASPDVSTVKGQRTEGLGYTAGVVVGYRISKHFAVETGALWEKKNYYSTGKYFSKSKLPVQGQQSTVIDLDGYCKMVDIPLNVHYFFGIKKNSNWFAEAGLSSYLMSKEWYDYNYYRPDGTGPYNKVWDYNTATRNWFSVIELGIGYERKLGGVGTLRVEPFIKVPATGIGIGSLPVTSFGINIGITRNIRW